jgi:hypothetical protein
MVRTGCLGQQVRISPAMCMIIYQDSTMLSAPYVPALLVNVKSKNDSSSSSLAVVLT